MNEAAIQIMATIPMPVRNPMAALPSRVTSHASSS